MLFHSSSHPVISQTHMFCLKGALHTNTPKSWCSRHFGFTTPLKFPLLHVLKIKHTYVIWHLFNYYWLSKMFINYWVIIILFIIFNKCFYLIIFIYYYYHYFFLYRSSFLCPFNYYLLFTYFTVLFHLYILIHLSIFVFLPPHELSVLILYLCHPPCYFHFYL